MSATAIDRVATRAAGAVMSGETVAPPTLRLLLRRFIASADEFRAPLGQALGMQAGSGSAVNPERLAVLAEAMQVADDPLIREIVAREAAAIVSAWPGRGLVADAARSVAGGLAAGAALGENSFIVKAIDELERIIAVTYEPGDGVSQTLSTRTRTTGDLATHAAVAEALLTGFELTGRPAYPMLAEELMRFAVAGASAEPPGLPTLDASRVLARLAVAQRDPDYRAAAVTGDGNDLRAVAERWLAAVDSDEALPLALASAYALALDEWLTVT